MFSRIFRLAALSPQLRLPEPMASRLRASLLRDVLAKTGSARAGSILPHPQSPGTASHVHSG